MESLYDLVYQGFMVQIEAQRLEDPSRRIIARATRPEQGSVMMYTATGATIAIAVSKLTMNLPAR